MRLLWILLLMQVLPVPAVFANDTFLLRLHGSNTVGAELAPALVKGWLYEQGYSGLQHRRLASEEAEIFARDPQGHEARVEIKSHGSSTAFRSLEQGWADIGMASRPIKMKENNRLKDYGDMTRRDAEFVIGLDGIAVITHRDNPIDHLQKSDIQKIFSGEIDNWNQLHRNMSGPIHVYARDNKSGTYDTFKSLVLGKKTLLQASARRYESNAELSDDVSRDPMGIGFVGLPYVRQAKAIAVAEQGTLPRRPHAFEVATEDYALARRLYMYVPSINANSKVQSFIDYCLSEAGQHIVEQSGFISQNLQVHSVQLDEGYPQEYMDMVEQGERLSLNFRFHKGSTKLDNKAMRDISRLVEFLSREENRDRKVMLFGFAESSETLPVFSLDLSTYRVDWVSDLLIQHGIDPVRVRAYGDAIPVASNEDAGGRHKNRRVEVWLQ